MLQIAVIVSLLSWVSGMDLPSGSLQGAIFFTDLPSKDLVRLDKCGSTGCGKPATIAKGLSAYGGLLPWNDALLAATRDNLVVQLDPWCQNSSCPVTPLVDTKRVPGLGDNETFSLGGFAWCHDSLYIVFGGKSAASGVLKCTDCSLGHDCTPHCSLVDGESKPGKGPGQLSGFAAGIACLGDHVLVTDNTNFRVQTIPVGCAHAPCEVGTFASGLKWPLGIAAVGGGKRVLVTLDDGIVSFLPDGSMRLDHWSIRQDSGFLFEAEGRIFIASGGDGNIVSVNPACKGPNCAEVVVWNSTGSWNSTVGGPYAATALAYMPYPLQVLIV